MTWGDQRWPVEKTKTHAFFEGVEWNALRDLQAPRPPTLSSITDTSYFPTEELADVPAQPAGVERLDADRDLAFLGCVRSSFVCVCACVCACVRAEQTGARLQVHVQAVYGRAGCDLMGWAWVWLGRGAGRDAD